MNLRGPTIVRIEKPPYDPHGSKLPPLSVYGK